MEKVDFGIIIQETISRCSQHRIREKPLVFLTLAPVLARVPWQDRSAEEFVRRFLYQALFTSKADAAIEVSLRRRFSLRNLNAFVGINPSYWIQFSVAGRGIRVAENLIDDLFSEVGLSGEKWLGITGSSTRLGKFRAIDAPQTKMVFCLETRRGRHTCDLLLPIADDDGHPELDADGAAVRTARP